MKTNFTIEEQNFIMFKGDTLSFGLDVQDHDRNPLEFTSASLTCKSKEGAVIFQKSLNDGITKGRSGLYKVRVAPEDTEKAEPGTYEYGLKIWVNDDAYTIMAGTIKIRPSRIE